MCDQDQELPLETAPHHVVFDPPKGSTIGRDILPWLRDYGHGKFRSVGNFGDLERHGGWTFCFTDPNTAFWFKIRFGGR